MTDDNKKYNIWDAVVKIVLIIIIVILLLHNCTILKKLNAKEDTKSPTGNVDIFEIKCEKDTCKEVLGDKTDKPAPEPDKPSVTPGGNTGNNNTTTPSGNTTKPSSGTDKPTNNNNSNNTTNSGNTSTDPGNDPGNDPGEDPEPTEVIVKDTKTWQSQNQLRIFSNPAYQMEPKIAPESSNTYEFIVRNNTSYDVAYKIDFIEENNNNINMKYRLKRGNTYVVGNDSTWVRYNDLD